MISKNQIKFIRTLHQKKQRDQHKTFIVEGVKSIQEVLRDFPELIQKIYATEAFVNEYLHGTEIPHETISGNELKLISLQQSPNEALALCHYFKAPIISTDLNKECAFYLSDIRDPGNLGTIMRICSWFGIKDLFCSPGCVELYNPKCIQSSMGAFLRVNVHYLEFDSVVNNSIPIYIADMEGEGLFGFPIKNGLIVIGNEANGVDPEIKKRGTYQIRIPGANQDTESLNAAMAASIFAAEYFRNK